MNALEGIAEIENKYGWTIEGIYHDEHSDELKKALTDASADNASEHEKQPEWLIARLAYWEFGPYEIKRILRKKGLDSGVAELIFKIQEEFENGEKETISDVVNIDEYSPKGEKEKENSEETKQNNKADIDKETLAELEKYAFSNNKLNWNFEKEFVTFEESVELPNGEKIEKGMTLELPRSRAAKLIDQGIAFKYRWKCVACGELHDQEKEPLICQPNCEKKNTFRPLHPTSHEDIADELMLNYNFLTVQESKSEKRAGKMFVYDNGVYRPSIAKGMIKEKVKKMLHDSTNTFRNKVLYDIAEESSVRSDELGLETGLVALEDGVLDLESMDFYEHDPERFFALSKIPVKHPDSHADCPAFKKLLRENIPAEEDRMRLQEICGTALAEGEKDHKKGAAIVGPTDAGKSTILEVIRMVLGEENVSSEPPHSIAHTRWGKAKLQNKLLNASDEMGEKLQNLQIMKKVMDGKPIDAERKRGRKFKFRATCEHIYCANQTPSASRSDDAFWNRWVVIETPESVQNKIKGLAEGIFEKEKEGILNWMIDGYKRFKATGGKHLDIDWERSRDRWLNWGNSVQRFIQHRVEHAQENKISSSELYERYKEYAEASDLDVEPEQQNVTKAVKNLSYARYSENYTIDGKENRRGFKGIMVKEPHSNNHGSPRKNTHNHTPNTGNKTSLQAFFDEAERENPVSYDKDVTEGVLGVLFNPREGANQAKNKGEKENEWNIRDIKKDIIDLLKQGENLSKEEISDRLDIPVEVVSKALDQLYDEGEVAKGGRGLEGERLFKFVGKDEEVA